jgi:acetylornithine deacetylase/succinyl-diaminopimelate desuccinylase-like protein
LWKREVTACRQRPRRIDNLIGLFEKPKCEILPAARGQGLAEIGAPATYGEPGFGTLARQWLRPTLEVNGLWGGYQGPGTKTVIPSEAFAKITCRLVAGQDPAVVLRHVRRHLETHVPVGVTLKISGVEEGAEAYRMPEDHFAVKAAAAVLSDVFGREPAFVGMGGSVPICSTFKHALNAETLFFSFSTGDEDIHAPNEFYRPERFRMGLEAWAKLWDRLAAGADASAASA